MQSISEKVLIDINFWQVNFKNMKQKMENMRDELNELGFMVGFKYDEQDTWCMAYKESPKTKVECKAELADNDYYVQILGEYLSLARVYETLIQEED